MNDFVPKPSIVEGVAPLSCRAVVVVPARNEEDSLAATCDSLLQQQDGKGRPLPPDSFEVILLLNNCTDASARVAERWRDNNRKLTLHVCERTFPTGEAHVGTARRLLMDSAWHRLAPGQRPDGAPVCGILTTDADTVIAPDWIFRTLQALEAGADVVGGAIEMDDSGLPKAVREAYRRDGTYQHLVSELEDRVDPQDGDPCPRHLHHFGGSLACTPQIYAKAGGVPPVSPLEDVAFIDKLRRIDARIRHEPGVRVTTSARMAGRVEVGLSGQLRVWQAMTGQGDAHRVPAAEFLRHRFTALRELRCFYRQGDEALLSRYGAETIERLRAARNRVRTCGEWLAEIDCNRLIDEGWSGTRDSPIEEAVAALERMLAGASGELGRAQ